MKCFSPMSVPRPGGSGAADRITVPCGTCLACIKNKAAEWSFRLNQEIKDAESSYFITLTYSDKTVPKIDTGGFLPKLSLRKRDLQTFFKRLRLYNEKEIKYFAVGEYGTHTYRPHYHIIGFNIDSEIDIYSAWTQSTKDTQDGLKVYDAIGKVDVGTVTPASINYVTGYLVGQNFKYGEYFDKDVEKPFRTMSKKIGENYMYDNYTWHKKEKRFYIQQENGNKNSLPRYYKEKIFSVKERMQYAEEARIEHDKDNRDYTMINEKNRKKANRNNKKLKL